MNFTFATSTRIVFGRGCSSELAAAAAEFGRRVLVVTGSAPERVESLTLRLERTGLSVECFTVAHEPSVKRVEEGLAQAREAGVEVVVSIGGGSVVDAGKAIAALLTNGGEPWDYLEGIGLGQSLSKPSAPFIAVPTTAGTGAEVTRNAVLGSEEHRVKVSMRSAFMLPRLALVDPELTLSSPPALTACTGLDALTQLIEAFVSARATPLTDGLCREALTRAARSIRKVYLDGNDLDAREDMALASLFSGLALANAGLGAAHGFAGPLGGLFSAPHGAVCARLLPEVMAVNARALDQRCPDSPARQRYVEVARVLTGRADAGMEDGLAWIRALCEEFSVPSLAEYGLREEDVAEVCDKARKASSMKGNPIVLAADELADLLHAAL